MDPARLQTAGAQRERGGACAVSAKTTTVAVACTSTTGED